MVESLSLELPIIQSQSINKLDVQVSELSAVLSSVAVPVFVPDRIIIFSSESFLFYSVSCVVTVSKHYTSGTRPPPLGLGVCFMSWEAARSGSLWIVR